MSDVSSRTVKKYSEFKELLLKYGVGSPEEYNSIIKGDGSDGFPESPEIFYGSEFEGWSIFAETKKARVASIDRLIQQKDPFGEYKIDDDDYAIIVDFINHVEDESTPLSMICGVKRVLFKKVLEVMRKEAVVKRKAF